MRFTIKYKLFLTLLLATLAVVVTMVLLMKWSFERGFLEYVNKVEAEIHRNLVDNLAAAYAENGSWTFLRDKPRRWQQIHRASMPVRDERDDDDDDPPPRNAGGRYESRSPGQDLEQGKPPRYLKHRKGRECVLDDTQQAVTPCLAAVADLKLREIIVDDHIVGYLASLPRKKLSRGHDLRFSEQQHRFLLLLGLCLALISTVLALPVSRLLVKPIKRVAAATRKLASGNYQTRISVHSPDELGDLSRDFNTLAITLESNEQARQQWIADISHELRTPLSVLRGEIEALQDGVRTLSAERLESLHNQVMNLNRLVNDLYELSMSDIGALNYHRERIDLAAVLQLSLDSMADEFAARQITISVEQKGGDMQLLADAERLQQLFANLLTNALRYTDAGGELRVRLENRAARLCLTLEDSAPGVAERDLPHLFERLYRVDNSRSRDSGGTGLGLAICRNIVTAHEGSISAAPSALGGLKISIEFPAA